MVTQERWQAIRKSLEKVSADFARLSRAVDPASMATDHWTCAETVAHVTAIGALYTSLLRKDPELAFPEVTETMLATTVEDVSVFNAVTLRAYRERRMPKVLDRFEQEIREILLLSEDVDYHAVVPWLGDSRVPISGLLAHLVNEMHVHGWDMARKNRVPWTIEPFDAAHFPEAFLTGVISSGYGRLTEGGDRARERRVAVQFRSDYTTTSTLALHRGVVTVEEPSPDDDVRLTFHPPTLNLMLFGRVSRTRAALTRGIRVSGPRPWLLPQFMRKVRLPSGPGEFTDPS